MNLGRPCKQSFAVAELILARIGEMGPGIDKDKAAERVGTSKKLNGSEGEKQPSQSSNRGMSGVGSWKCEIHTNPIQSNPIQSKQRRQNPMESNWQGIKAVGFEIISAAV
jgi:hypothetical protein